MFWKKTNHKRCFSFMCVGICGYYRAEFGDKYFINTQQRLGKNSEYRRLLNPRSCNGICLDPSCPRTTDQLEPAEEVKGVWKTRKRGERAKAAQNDVAFSLIGRGLALFRNETTGKREIQLHPQRNVSTRLWALSPCSLTPLKWTVPLAKGAEGVLFHKRCEVKTLCCEGLRETAALPRLSEGEINSEKQCCL